MSIKSERIAYPSTSNSVCVLCCKQCGHIVTDTSRGSNSNGNSKFESRITTTWKTTNAHCVKVEASTDKDKQVKANSQADAQFGENPHALLCLTCDAVLGTAYPSPKESAFEFDCSKLTSYSIQSGGTRIENGVLVDDAEDEAGLVRRDRDVKKRKGFRESAEETKKQKVSSASGLDEALAVTEKQAESSRLSKLNDDLTSVKEILAMFDDRLIKLENDGQISKMVTQQLQQQFMTIGQPFFQNTSNPAFPQGGLREQAPNMYQQVLTTPSNLVSSARPGGRDLQSADLSGLNRRAT